MHTINHLIFGCDPPPPELVPLRAGPFTAFFDPETVFLRRISLGQKEIIRGIYAALRDQDWGTIPARLCNLRSQILPRSFQLEFDVECHQPPILFRWHGVYSGDEHGTISCEFSGCAETTFLRNRIGFCVLHPIAECAGAPVEVRHPDGTADRLKFPEIIEPQIFGKASLHDLASLSHQVRPGVWANLLFEGDVFETEDQRNWTDASYKTYCTPLSKPSPVKIPAGTRIYQKVTLTLASEAPLAIESVQNKLVTFTIPPHPTATLPEMGSSLPAPDVDLSSVDLSLLRNLHLSHLRADLHLHANDWQSSLRSAVLASQETELPLELAIHFNDEAELTTFATELDARRSTLKHFIVFHQNEPATRQDPANLARRILSRFGVPIGGGTNAHFCELNREQALGQFVPDSLDFLSWPITPQVHATDHLSIVENLEAQSHTLAAARTFAQSKPLVISPLTLRPRFNAVATTESTNQRVPEIDPRQHSLFAAAWTLGSIAVLISGGAKSITLYEVIGPRGLTFIPRLNEKGALEALPALLSILQSRAHAGVFFEPNIATGIAVYNQNLLKSVLLSNLSRNATELELRLPTSGRANVRSFTPYPAQQTSSIENRSIRLTMPPYALYRIDIDTDQKLPTRS